MAPAWPTFVCAFLSASAGMTAGAVRAASIPIQLLDGKPCARCMLAGPQHAVPANVVIDLGMRAPLVLHDQMVKLLEVSSEQPCTVRFDEVALERLSVIGQDLSDLSAMSGRYAAELGEIPLAGVVGLPAFEPWVVVLDIAGGTLSLEPADAQDSDGATAADAAATAPASRTGSLTSLAYREEGHGCWLTGQTSDEMDVRVKFGTWQRVTVIDSIIADLAGHPAGDVPILRLGGINVAEFVALRPEDLSGFPDPVPDVILGTDLLACFRLSIDTQHKRMHFEQLREPSFPADERAFYVARYDRNADGIEAFLTAHPKSRLAEEAAELLLTLRREARPADREALMRAVKLRSGYIPVDRRASRLMTLADELLAADIEDGRQIARDVLDLAAEWAGDDLNGTAVHHLQARRGLLALMDDDTAAARRHLLSAAFGLPKDGMVNLWLGECYLRMGKPVRAWSRFVQAALAEEPPSQAWKFLDRLHHDPKFRKTFSMSEAEQMLEGRIPALHAASRYAEDAVNEADGSDHRPARLVELFTCIDAPATAAPELACSALAEYLADEGTVFVTYHLPSPAPDPMFTQAAASRATYYGVTTAPAAVFDGGEPITAGGEEAAADALFAAYRKASRLPDDATGGGTAIDLHAACEAGRIRGSVSATQVGGGDGCRLHVLLTENVLIVPGANGVVLRRHVARALLTPPEGVAVAAAGGAEPFTIDVAIEDIERRLAGEIDDLETELNVEFLMRPTFVDPSAVSIVAFVQDMQTRRILAARSLDTGADRP